LAQWLGEQIEQIRPYSTWIVVGVIVVVAGFVTTMLIRNWSAAAKVKGWTPYHQAVAQNDMEKLTKVATDFADAPAGEIAALMAANRELNEGSMKVYQDHEEAQLKLNKAVEQFTPLSESGKDPDIKSRATFGLATAYSCLGDLENAKTNYDKVAEEWPDSALAKLAVERSQRLSRPEVGEFVAWFHEQDLDKLRRQIEPPTTQGLPGTGGGISGDTPLPRLDSPGGGPLGPGLDGPDLSTGGGPATPGDGDGPSLGDQLGITGDDDDGTDSSDPPADDPDRASGFDPTTAPDPTDSDSTDTGDADDSDPTDATDLTPESTDTPADDLEPKKPADDE